MQINILLGVFQQSCKYIMHITEDSQKMCNSQWWKWCASHTFIYLWPTTSVSTAYHTFICTISLTSREKKNIKMCSCLTISKTEEGSSPQQCFPAKKLSVQLLNFTHNLVNWQRMKDRTWTGRTHSKKWQRERVSGCSQALYSQELDWSSCRAEAHRDWGAAQHNTHK